MDPTRIAHTRAVEWPKPGPGRFAQNIRRDTSSGCELALLGLPDDTGILLNGGRPGASGGPAAVRAALAVYGTTWDGAARQQLRVGVFDAGDVEPASGNDEAALFETHARVEAAVRALHELGLVPICIGGGHDLSLPSITALSKYVGGPVGGINVDAHLDVRERVGSGMPFRRLIESNAVDPRRFVEFGLGQFANDASDFSWLEARGATLILADHTQHPEARPMALLTRALAGASAGFLSIDMDALDGSVVSGVSALNPAGLDVRSVAELAQASGADARILHFDLMELSPLWDASGRSARVAAHLILSFVAGFARRGV
jgi:formimidoylglutamase